MGQIYVHCTFLIIPCFCLFFFFFSKGSQNYYYYQHYAQPVQLVLNPEYSVASIDLLTSGPLCMNAKPKIVKYLSKNLV